MGFDPGSPGSCPGPKAGAKPLRHPGIPCATQGSLLWPVFSKNPIQLVQPEFPLSPCSFFVISHSLTPPCSFAYKSPLVLLFRMEFSSLLRSLPLLPPHSNISRIKYAFTALTSVWLWLPLTHRCHRRKVHMEKIHLFIQKRVKQVGKAGCPSSSESEGVNATWTQSIFGLVVNSVLSSPDTSIHLIGQV